MLLLDGNNGNHFAVNGSTGVVTLVSKLGTSVLEYTLNISATDGIHKDHAEVR